ncbi:MAG TPA: beta-ketoacyl synthase N-terminal-like domain-containing protein, partial [Solirubrobacteraceae bacterium]
MSTPAEHAIAVVGVGAILPDAPNAAAFWDNVTGGRYSISEVESARWDPALYYDADPKAPERSYSKIGGWVRDWEWDPLGWHLPIPPKVSESMDHAQKWGVACTRMALQDYGWPERPLDLERTAVVLGNAMAGELHYLTSMRLSFPDLARRLEQSPSYAALPDAARAAIIDELHANVDAWLPPTTEDTMPGELGNCLAGRIANLFNFRGPNFVVDAACASAMAAMDASIEGLVEGEFDAVLTGGIDRNMSAATFIKFCAIGALSATGTRPYRDGADGFVMGEGASLMLLKRLTDAERDGDRIYAVVRGIAGSSDGRGKGITAPNPIGQKLAVERAWAKSGLTPDVCSLIEGHGTSTRVGDLVELTALAEVFAGAGLAPGSVPIGSVKSNIGHLKGAAGAAGLLKAALALHHKVLPPSLGGEPPNPNLDWSASPFSINAELRAWEPSGGAPRVAGVSAFGFGGTNFHAVLEEYVPGRFDGDSRSTIAVPGTAPRPNRRAAAAPPAGASAKAPLRGALVLGDTDAAGLAAQLRAVDGRAPSPAQPDPATLRAPERLAIDFGDADELAAKAAIALKALEGGNPAAWKALRARGIFRGSGPAPKVAFLYTGQGSQYANMLAELREIEPIVAATFAEADEIMRPLLDGRALSDIVFVDPADEGAMAQATAELMRTEITQPAVLTADIALTRLLAAYGIEPDLVMGHSLGEYGALVAAGVLPFAEALEAVSARGHEMASLDLPDPGKMAAISAPAEVVEAVIAETDGYVVLANVNSSKQVVLGGASAPVEAVVARLQEQGHQATLLPVSHAFHTELVAPASEPLRATLRRLHVAAPRIPVVANVDGRLYPTGPGAVERIIEILGRQVASPVQFVDGLRTLWDEGARVFVETGPKRALQGFASDVLGDDEALNLMTNHPKNGDLPSFNAALCGLYASGVGAPAATQAAAPAAAPAMTATPAPVAAAGPPSSDATLLALGRVFADALERGRELLAGAGVAGDGAAVAGEPVVITGAALGLPGTERTFDPGNVARLLHGEQFIDVIPSKIRHEIADRRITRLVKGDDGEASFQVIDDVADVIKLAARAGGLDLEAEFGVDAGRLAALGRDTQLAIAAGIDALRDAGLPLIQHYKTTTTGSQLPDRWTLPPALRDDTGIVFASAFPGLDELTDELNRYWADRSRRDQLRELEQVLSRVPESDEVARTEIERHLHDLRTQLEEHAYTFDRRFLFRVLSMGHSQFAELIGARGPNTQINSACASTTQAIALAEDWIRAGRCRRVVVIAADDATSDEMLPWIGSGFLATGAAATDEVVEDAALPFDARRHGMLLGMGAAAFVVERADAARERGITPICEVLGAVTANSAFHGTRLDVEHIGQVMEEVVAQAETRGISRAAIAHETLFISHETYTPARGGSAAAEIHALRRVFGDRAGEIVIANTKGYTGHPMGVGIEDALAVKALETGIVPPVPNFREIDPSLGELNLSKGGSYPITYALRLAAGFGSQISMMLLRWTPVPDGRRRSPEELGYAYRVSDPAAWATWLSHVSGQETPELEVVQHRLRVIDRGPGAVPAPQAPAPPAAAPPPEPAAPAPVPAAPVAVAAAPVPAGDDITERVLGIVAEQTGYPTDLLDP